MPIAAAMCRFHLLTREFYGLVKQRLAPGGAAAFNVHDGQQALLPPTVKTLGEVFAALDLYPTGPRRSDRGRQRCAARCAKPWKAGLRRWQKQHGFRFSFAGYFCAGA